MYVGWWLLLLARVWVSHFLLTTPLTTPLVPGLHILPHAWGEDEEFIRVVRWPPCYFSATGSKVNVKDTVVTFRRVCAVGVLLYCKGNGGKGVCKERK